MRREFYPTLSYEVDALVSRVHLESPILEPCSGDGDISRELDARGFRVTTNEVDPEAVSHFHLDATKEESWSVLPEAKWVVTNPPFSLASAILQHAWEKASIGIAFYLRLSWLEPTKTRYPWHASHPLDALVILPRASYSGASSDMVTRAWFVWRKEPIPRTVVSFVKKPQAWK